MPQGIKYYIVLAGAQTSDWFQAEGAVFTLEYSLSALLMSCLYRASFAIVIRASASSADWLELEEGLRMSSTIAQ